MSGFVLVRDPDRSALDRVRSSARSSIAHRCRAAGIDRPGLLLVADQIAGDDTTLVGGDISLTNRAALAAELGDRVAASDEELVLAGFRRWGTEVAHHLRGRYTFVVIDGSRTVAIRDPFGQRPLHHAAVGDRLVVASEVRQIRAVTTLESLDLIGVVHGLSGWWGDPIRTMWDGISRLPPGSVATFDGAQLDVVAETGRPTIPPEADRSPAETVAAVRAAVEAAVADAVAAAGDGPVVSDLSGGLDSSAITALVVGELGDPARVLAVFKSIDDERFDDEPYAAAQARHLGVELHRFTSDTCADDFIAAARFWSDFPGNYGEDLADRIEEFGAAHGATLHLNGQQGEILEGSWLRPVELLRRGRVADALAVGGLRRRVRQMAVNQVQRMVPSFRPVAVPWIDEDLRRAAGLHRPEPFAALTPRRVCAAERRARFLDPEWDRYVTVEERGAARRGIDTVRPFIDERVVLEALATPEAHFFDGADGRRLHRSAFADVYAPEVVARRGSADFRRSQQDYIDLIPADELVDASALVPLGIVDRDALAAFVTTARRPDAGGRRRFELAGVVEAEFFLRSL